MKKRMIRFTLPCLLMAMFCFCIQALPAMDTPSPDVIKAAEHGLVAFLGDNVSARDMKLGASFHIHTIAPAFDADTATLDSLAFPTGNWRFLVLSGNEPFAMLTVAQMDGKWQAVSIGGAGIAKELFQVTNRWPAGEGYTYRFIRIFQARSDFIEISHHKQLSGFVPLTSSRISFQLPGHFDPATMMRNSEIFPQLKDIMSKHAQEPMLPGRK